MNDKTYKYDGTDTFPKKIKTSDGYILTKVNDGIYDNSFLPEYMNERGDLCVISDVEKYNVVETNDFRFYIYDFLIGQHILTIDTVNNRTRLDRLNIYGQCYSFGDKWEKVTKATINRALKRDGYVYDDYIKEHFTDREKRLKDKVLFKSNDYNDCIKFIAMFGKEKEHRSNIDYENYYKKYLDIPENKIGEILEDGTVKKEYCRQGNVYKNFANFYRREGICYISEYQTDKITSKSKEGEDYETYQSIYNKVKQAFENEKVNQEKYSIEDFTETIMNDLDWQYADSLIPEYIEALDDEYFLDEEETETL